MIMSDLLSSPVRTLQGDPTTLGELTGGRPALVVNVVVAVVPSASVTVMVTLLAGCCAVGVPETTPVAASSAMPSGSVPAVTA